MCSCEIYCISFTWKNLFCTYMRSYGSNQGQHLAALLACYSLSIVMFNIKSNTSLEAFIMHVFFRHIISAVHFNNNLLRDDRKNEDGTEQIKIVHPKFKMLKP